MKKLIKSGVCGTHEQYIYALFTKDRSTVAAERKKKKKRKRRRSTFKCYPNIHLILPKNLPCVELSLSCTHEVIPPLACVKGIAFVFFYQYG